MTRSGSKREGGVVMNIHRITKFGLKEERTNNRGLKMMIVHRRVEGL